MSEEFNREVDKLLEEFDHNAQLATNSDVTIPEIEEIEEPRRVSAAVVEEEESTRVPEAESAAVSASRVLVFANGVLQLQLDPHVQRYVSGARTPQEREERRIRAFAGLPAHVRQAARQAREQYRGAGHDGRDPPWWAKEIQCTQIHPETGRRCSTYFVDEFGREGHERRYHELSRLWCRVCYSTRTFAKREDYDRHLRKYHSGRTSRR